MAYANKTGVSGSNYAYVAAKQASCYRNTYGAVSGLGPFCDVTLGGDENMLKQLVATRGAVAVAIYASNAFTQYSGYLFTDNTCNTGTVNHAVIVVGYGTDSSGDFWWVRNSWGTSWGSLYGGYAKFARNRFVKISIG